MNFTNSFRDWTLNQTGLDIEEYEIMQLKHLKVYELKMVCVICVAFLKPKTKFILYLYVPYIWQF